MKFFNLLIGVAAAESALAAPAGGVLIPARTQRRTPKSQFVGIDETGAEFGKDTLPGQLGKHYT